MSACGGGSTAAPSSSAAPGSTSATTPASSAASSTAAASSSAASSAPGSSSTAASSSAAVSAGYPVEIPNAFGTTTIASAPQRVVVVGYTEADSVLALGTVPLAVQEFGFPGKIGGPWLDDLLQGQTPTVLTGQELNLEQIASFTPDLIIGVNRALTADDYAALTAIAPTLARPAEYPDYGVPPEAVARTVAQALDKGPEMEAKLAEVDQTISAASVAHPEFAGKTFSAVWPRGDGQGWYAWTAVDARSRLLVALGLTESPTIAGLGQDTFYKEISAENTAQIDADVIVAIDVEGQRATIEADPIYQSLPAVQAGHVAWITDPAVIGAFSYSSVLSTPYALDPVVEAVAAATA
nr:iron-siderophore ABC transporter substrate-binding protein [Nakamurella flavida]